MLITILVLFAACGKLWCRPDPSECFLQRLVNAAAQKYPSYGSKHDGDGWTEALEALTAAAPALGVRLDAWAGLAAGNDRTPTADERTSAASLPRRACVGLPTCVRSEC